MSNAVDINRVSSIVGYKITKGNFSTVNPNLPQRIAILAEANEANQTTLDLTPKEINSTQQAGQLYGYGSPIYNIARILHPINGGGVGSIPVVVYPQAKAAGAVAKVLTVTPTGVATGNATHTVVINGRKGLDGEFYDINIVAGDGPDEVSQKITDAVNAVLGCPVSAIATSGVGAKSTLTAKWAGLTTNDINVSVNNNGKDLGITYAVASSVAGSGTPSVQAALNLFGNDWNTIVINSYGAVTSVMDALEAFNGKPDPVNPTGRYTGIVMKPFIALTGSMLEDPSSITDSRKDDVTIVICPAPLSKGLPLEAAANAAVLFAKQANDTPHLDLSGRSYPDMPTPTYIGMMTNYNDRDTIVKKGCSTVDLVSGKYKLMDFVTTYHPVGENPPQFRYCRNIMLDMNVYFAYYLLEQLHVVGHSIAANDDVVNVSNVVKPKQWKQIVDGLAEMLAKKNIIVDAKFMQDSTTVNLSTTNPDRLETFFRYKRSGFARIASTTAEAGFNFGTLN